MPQPLHVCRVHQCVGGSGFVRVEIDFLKDSLLLLIIWTFFLRLQAGNCLFVKLPFVFGLVLGIQVFVDLLQVYHFIFIVVSVIAIKIIVFIFIPSITWPIWPFLIFNQKHIPFAILIIIQFEINIALQLKLTLLLSITEFALKFLDLEVLRLDNCLIHA